MKCTVEQKDRIVSYKGICDFIYENNGVPKGGIISVWCKTDNIDNLLRDVRNNPNTKYIIITHESDHPINAKVVNNLPVNVIKLFGQNITHKDSRVESIPIGSTCVSWVGIDDYALGKTSNEYRIIEEDGKEKDFKNLALIDFAIRTNPQHRQSVFNHFTGKSWVTEKPCNLQLNDYKNSQYFNHIDTYLKDLYNHKFIISPLGNGVDCGRNWQAIYLGSIPVVPRHINIEYYDELPILVYDDINELTEEYLNMKWDEMKSQTFNMDKAKLSYWGNRIKTLKSGG